LWHLPADPDSATRDLADVAAARLLLSDRLVLAPGITVVCGERTTPVWVQPTAETAVSVLPGCPPASSIDVHPPTPIVRRTPLADGSSLVELQLRRDAAGFADDVTVVAARQLTVEEIIARHQA